MRLHGILLLLTLIILTTLAAGCAGSQNAPVTDATTGAVIVGSWLEEGHSTDLLIHFYPNQSAAVRYLVAVQNQEATTVTRQGTWEPLALDRVNLTYTTPFTMEDRTFTIQVNGNRAKVVHAYNRTEELPDSRQGRLNASFIRVSNGG